MNPIPPVNKNKVLVADTDDHGYDDDDNNDIDDIYLHEKQYDYDEATVIILQKAMLEYVDRKSLTICEYLSVEKIKKYLGYR